VWAERAHCLFDILRREAWHQAGGGGAEVVQVWRARGAGVLGRQGVGDSGAVAQRCGFGKGGTPFAEGLFAAEVDASLLA